MSIIFLAKPSSELINVVELVIPIASNLSKDIQTTINSMMVNLFLIKITKKIKHQTNMIAYKLKYNNQINKINSLVNMLNKNNSNNHQKNQEE
jgi:hypothetical protein